MVVQNVILDLDSTCISSQTFTEKEDEMLWKKLGPELKKRKDFYRFQLEDGTWVWGFKRPNLDKFIEFCFSHFDNVGIWTAAQKEYGLKISEIILGDNKPLFIFTREQCDEVVNPKTGEISLWKPLKLAFRKYKQMTAKNTWFVDDNYDYAREDKLNHIPIAEFEVDVAEGELPDPQDDKLLALIEFFKAVKDVKNVQVVVRIWKVNK